jgi:glycolate oxidase FAD binding subunit
VNANVCQIDDVPLPVVRPGSVAELGDLVRGAAAEDQGLYPLGGGTMLGLGLPPARAGRAVDLRGLSQLIDYPARDMTVTVQAGMTIAELQRLLHGENQRLLIDVPQAERATVGGTLAVNSSGPRRYAAGTLRDYVIGISFVNDLGQEVKAGGRVVKNVAGYDLCKLHVGALGTLGIITQVTFKLRPMPESTSLITFGCSAGELAGVLDQLHQSRTRPVCLDVLNGRAAGTLAGETGLDTPEAPWLVVVGYEGSDQSVTWQVQHLLHELAATPVMGLEVRAGTATTPLWNALVEWGLRPSAILSFKANLLPSATAELCLKADGASPEILLHAHAGSGIVRGHLPGATTLPQAAALLTELQPLAQAAQGSLIVSRCPAGWKKSMPIWGVPRGDIQLMRQVKDKLDPRHLFNPGRFLD